jgi:hypothetical protein
MNIIKILKAKLRNKNKLLGEKWYNDRINACNSCPLNSINTNKKNLWYRFWDLLNFKKPFCTVCGCEIKAKASEKLEECSDENNKKWEAIEDN